MTDTNFLDLDAAVPVVKKTVRIDGQDYPFKEPTVEDFSREITRLRDIKKQVAALAELSEDERQNKEAEMMVVAMLDGIRQAFPSMPEDVIKGLSMSRITAIRTFIQNEVEADAEDESGNA